MPADADGAGSISSLVRVFPQGEGGAGKAYPPRSTRRRTTGAGPRGRGTGYIVVLRQVVARYKVDEMDARSQSVLAGTRIIN